MKALILLTFVQLLWKVAASNEVFEGDRFSENGDTYIWYKIRDGVHQAFSTTGIVQEEYDLYVAAVEDAGAGQAKTPSQLASDGVIILPLEDLAWKRKSTTHFNSTHTRKTLEKRDGCSIFEDCIAPGAEFCKFYFYEVANYFADHWPTGATATWNAILANPLLLAASSAAIGAGVGARVTYLLTVSATGTEKFEPGEDCTSAQKKLANIVKDVSTVCHAEAVARDECIHACQVYIEDTSRNVSDDTISINVNVKGAECAKNPPCSSTCHSGG